MDWKKPGRKQESREEALRATQVTEEDGVLSPGWKLTDNTGADILADLGISSNFYFVTFNSLLTCFFFKDSLYEGRDYVYFVYRCSPNPRDYRNDYL